LVSDDVDQLAHAYPEVPAPILRSVLAAYRRLAPTVPAAVRAAHLAIGAAHAAVISSIGSHQGPDGTSVAVYLTQHDVDLINLGFPVDLHAPDHQGGTLSVHVMRERRRVPRPDHPV
jgi:hypothetical protein